MKLISMTSFVLENAKQPYVEGTKYKDLVNYAKFIDTPLKLENFIVCDEEGDILEEPTNYEKRLLNMMTEYNDEVYTYYQAKVKVLFEGFEIDKNLYLVYKNEISIGRFISYENGSKFLFRDNFKTIEDLVEFGFKLTENTIKQIGL